MNEDGPIEKPLDLQDLDQPIREPGHVCRGAEDEARGQDVGEGAAAGLLVDLGVLGQVLLAGAGPAEDEDEGTLALLDDEVCQGGVGRGDGGEGGEGVAEVVEELRLLGG